MKKNDTQELFSVLARIEERIEGLKAQNETKFENIDENIRDVKRSIERGKKYQDTNFVKKESFRPIKRMVNGIMTLIITSVISILVAAITKLLQIST